MEVAIVMLLWSLFYIAVFVRAIVTKRRIVLGGLMLFAISFMPMIYGRWTTPDDWHDSPLMGIYYIPAMLAALLSLVVLITGIVVVARRALSNRRIIQ